MVASTMTTTATAPIVGWLESCCIREPTQTANRGAPVQMLRLTRPIATTRPTRRRRTFIYVSVFEYSPVSQMATPRLTRAEQRERTREALLDAAGRVFVERGFGGASVEAIAAEAGYTRGAFYSNFAGKEELFTELLQRRAFDRYRDIVRESAERPGGMPPREVGERAAAVQAHGGARWLFGLWLEVLAHAGRDDGTRALAAEFWRATRAMGTEQVERAFAKAGQDPPVAPREIASAMIALDLGLALQRYVDPEQVPLDAYGDLYDLLFGGLEP